MVCLEVLCSTLAMHQVILRIETHSDQTMSQGRHTNRYLIAKQKHGLRTQGLFSVDKVEKPKAVSDDVLVRRITKQRKPLELLRTAGQIPSHQTGPKPA